MHPLEELERHYIEVRRQVESGQLPASEGLRRVHERTVIDAAGVVWRVDTDPRRSTSSHAEFETVDRNNVATSANSSSFAFQAPTAQFSVSDIPQSFPQGAPQGMPQGVPQGTPQPGGFQLAQPGSFGPSPTIPTESPSRRRRDASEKGPTEGKDKKVKKKKEKLPEGFASGSPISRLTNGMKNMSFTPVTIGAIAVVFILAVLAFLFFSSSSDAPSAPATTVQTPTSSSVPTDSTSSIPADSTTPGDITTTSVLTSDTTTTMPGSTPDTTVTTMPGSTTIPGAPTTPPMPTTTTPLAPPATNSSGVPTR